MSPQSAAPRPSYAEHARKLVHLASTGMLSTVSRRHAGHPFGSVMPYALDEQGMPLFLISAMAVHTQNLEVDPRASLLVTPPDWSSNPLAGERVTLMGRAARLTHEERSVARPAYLARHPEASQWVDFGDFAFWRLEVADIYYVGGFGAMGWVTVADYATARP
jgi:putative heme iron utilization protein